MKVIFVCTGNTCRSPMAEGYFKHLCHQAGKSDFQVSSAGTYAVNGAPASPQAVRVLKSLQVDIQSHLSRGLTREMLEDADYVVCMTEGHRQQILEALPEVKSKLSLLLDHAGDGAAGNVADPVGGSLQTYMECFMEMKPALENLFLDISS